MYIGQLKRKRLKNIESLEDLYNKIYTPSPNNKKVIYKILTNNEIVLYVGKTKNFKQRVSSHLSSNGINNMYAESLYRGMDKILYLVLDDSINEATHHAVEQYLIDRNKPTCNVSVPKTFDIWFWGLLPKWQAEIDRDYIENLDINGFVEYGKTTPCLFLVAAHKHDKIYYTTIELSINKNNTICAKNKKSFIIENKGGSCYEQAIQNIRVNRNPIKIISSLNVSNSILKIKVTGELKFLHKDIKF